MPLQLTPRERILAIATALLATLALLAPSFAQPLNYHAFADQRTLAAVPHAMDVLSNLPFAMFSIAGSLVLVLAYRVKAIKFPSAGLLALFLAACWSRPVCLLRGAGGADAAGRASEHLWLDAHRQSAALGCGDRALRRGQSA